MTCIVAVEDRDGVCMAADSAGLAGYARTLRADSKVFTVGPYVLGFTDSFRMGQLLRYRLEVPDFQGWDVDRHIATTFVDAVRACLKAGGWQRTDQGQEQGGTFLVGFRRRLYTVHSDFQAGRTFDGYAAVGSGFDLALGSLHTTAPLDLPVRDRLTAALSAAAHFNAGVAEPFVYTQEPT